MTVNDERNAGFRASLGSALFFEIVCCRWAGTNEIENRSLILRHPKMTNTLWLGEKTACRPRFQFALVEFLADAVIERAAQHHYVSVIGMRMGLEVASGGHSSTACSAAMFWVTPILCVDVPEDDCHSGAGGFEPPYGGIKIHLQLKQFQRPF